MGPSNGNAPLQRPLGITVIELLVVLAVVGILAGIGVALIPRQGIAVSQGQRILATAIQFARLEAIRRNATVQVDLSDGAADVVVALVDDPSVVLRRFALDPQGGRVTLKRPSANTIEFNSRGVAVLPMTRTVEIGIVGTNVHDIELQISGQGAVRAVD